MINNWKLKLRMLFSGSILFSIYALGALVLMSYYNISLNLIIFLTFGFLVFQYVLSQKLILKSVKARELPQDFKWIENFSDQYAKEKNISKPDIYLASMGSPNAFAFGRQGNGTVVLSEQLINKLNREEVKGVVSHELAHIENRDSIIMLLGQSVSTIIGFAAILFSRQKGATIIGAIIAGEIAQFVVFIVLMAISRYREYVADQTASSYMGTGEPLASALEKISSNSKTNKKVSNEVGALCIIDPGEILSSHPPVESRIKRLRKSENN